MLSGMLSNIPMETAQEDSYSSGGSDYIAPTYTPPYQSPTYTPYVAPVTPTYQAPTYQAPASGAVNNNQTVVNAVNVTPQQTLAALTGTAKGTSFIDAILGIFSPELTKDVNGNPIATPVINTTPETTQTGGILSDVESFYTKHKTLVLLSGGGLLAYILLKD